MEESKDFIIEGNLPAEGEIKKILGIEQFEQAEWVFQFDDDEPVVMAWSSTESEPGQLNFVLSADSESSIIFQSPDGKKTMRLFCRKMSEETRKKRTK